VVPSESAASTFFTDIKEWVRRGCRFYLKFCKTLFGLTKTGQNR
jgi:hypothetical protein